MAVRIIPKLEIKGENLVKGIRFDGLRVLGSPHRIAKHYYDHGADELIYVDIVASLYDRNNLLDIVTKTASDIFIPLTVGGGIRTLDDIQNALLAGADKVAINTAAIKEPSFIRKAANRFGSSTIVVQIETQKRAEGKYEAFTDNGRESTGFDALEWAKQVIDLGAGEILLTSVDRDGTGMGIDLSLVQIISDASNVPVVVGGGVGKIQDAVEAIQTNRIDGLTIASCFHYEQLNENNIDHSCKTQIENKYRGSQYDRKCFGNISPFCIPSLKQELNKKNIPCIMHCEEKFS